MFYFLQILHQKDPSSFKKCLLARLSNGFGSVGGVSAALS